MPARVRAPRRPAGRLFGRRPTAGALVRVALCLAAGFAVWASFPPLSCWWAAPVGVAALLVVLGDVSAPAGAGLGFVFGLGLLVPMMSFLRGIGVDAWLVVAVLEALWFALQGAVLAVVRRRLWWPLAAPAVWLAVEWARDRFPFGGFPWARIAFGQASGPLLPLAAWGGAPLVGFVVVALGAALAWTVHRVSLDGIRRPRIAAAVAVTGAVAGMALGLAAVVPVPTHGSTRGGASHVVVAAVQGDVPRLGLAAFAQRRTVTQFHLDQTRVLAGKVQSGTLPAPAFVVWPENASDQDPFTDPVARSMVEQAVAAVNVPILVGAVVNGPDAAHVQNTAIVWSPATGPGETYVKRHLVPFGEYLPLRHVLTRIAGRFSLIAKDFAPGRRPGVLDIAGVRIADAICFEVADDDVVREAVTGGGRLLVVQTNNATYERRGDDGHGGETAQQLEMSRLRAVEHGRAVVVAATSGVSAVINPAGRVLQRSGVYTPAVLVADVPLRDARTVSDRVGTWPERVVAAMGLLALLLALPRRRGSGGSPAPTEPSPPAVLAAQP